MSPTPTPTHFVLISFRFLHKSNSSCIIRPSNGQYLNNELITSFIDFSDKYICKISPVGNFSRCNELRISLSEFLKGKYNFLSSKREVCGVGTIMVRSNTLLLFSDTSSAWFVQFLNFFLNLVQINKFPYFPTWESFGKIPVQSQHISKELGSTSSQHTFQTLVFVRHYFKKFLI